MKYIEVSSRLHNKIVSLAYYDEVGIETILKDSEGNPITFYISKVEPQKYRIYDKGVIVSLMGDTNIKRYTPTNFYIYENELMVYSTVHDVMDEVIEYYLTLAKLKGISEMIKL